MSLEDTTLIFLKDLGRQYPTENSKEKRRFGLYQCGYCGKEFKAIISNIKRRHTKSCGCIIYKNFNTTTHGFRSHRFYGIWNSMIQRCTNRNTNSYKDYGGRGISVCEEWQDVKNFIDWAEATHPNVEDVSLDRIEVEGNYNPDNCRWADATTQAINRRMMKNNTSGFVGVEFIVLEDKYTAMVGVYGKRIHLGTFKTIEEAVQARDNYIIQNNLPHKLSSEYEGK
jgi:hypothetical protein